MRMAKYCKDLGMTLEGFRAYEQTIKSDSQTIYNKATVIRPQGTGMYFPTSELIEVREQRDMFILDELRQLGVEFIENGAFYRI